MFLFFLNLLLWQGYKFACQIGDEVLSYDQCPDSLKFTGEQLVDSMGFQMDRTGRNVGILVGQFFVYRLLGVLILSIKFYVQTATQRPKFMVKFHAMFKNT